MPINKFSTTNLLLENYGETVIDIYYATDIPGFLTSESGQKITDIVFKFSNKDIRKKFDTSDYFSKITKINKNSYDINGSNPSWSVNIVSKFFTLTLSSTAVNNQTNGKSSQIKLGNLKILNQNTEVSGQDGRQQPPKILYTSPTTILDVRADTQTYDLLYSGNNDYDLNIYLQTDVNKINFNYILKEPFVYDYLTHIIINEKREVTIENVNNINIPNDKNVIIENTAILNIYGFKDDLDNFKRQYILTNETPTINTITQTTYQSVNGGVLNMFYKKPIQNINYNSELKLLTFDIHHVSHISKTSKQYNFKVKLYTIKKGRISEFQTIKDTLENIDVNNFNDTIKPNNIYLVPDNNCNYTSFHLVKPDEQFFHFVINNYRTYYK